VSEPSQRLLIKYGEFSGDTATLYFQESIVLGLDKTEGDLLSVFGFQEEVTVLTVEVQGDRVELEVEGVGEQAELTAEVEGSYALLGREGTSALKEQTLLIYLKGSDQAEVA